MIQFIVKKMGGKKSGFIVLLVFLILVILANFALFPIFVQRYQACKSNQYTLWNQMNTLQQSMSDPNQVIMGVPGANDKWSINCSSMNGEQLVYLSINGFLLTQNTANNVTSWFLIQSNDPTVAMFFKLIPTGSPDQYALVSQGSSIVSNGSNQQIAIGSATTGTPFTLKPVVSSV